MSATPLIATYRLQLTPSFGFGAAAAICPYLCRLGVSHLYLSPIFESRRGSTHGYDQTDPRRLREELGGQAGFESLAKAARREGLGIVVDIVPNHMAADHANPWWWGLLREGPGSAFDRFFDVDWDAGDGRVILPVLGKSLEEATAAGELAIEEDEAGAARLKYFDKLFPLREGSGKPGQDVPDVLRAQHYELVHWRMSLQSLNYRRFFDISDLAGVQVDDPMVFESMHAGVFALAARGMVDGVRVDHVDGLADPAGYLRALRRRLDEVTPAGRRVFVIVEKILARAETLPDSCPVDGTTGYEFIAGATQLGISRDGLAQLREHGVRSGAAVEDYGGLARRSKAEMATRLFKPEVRRVVRCALEAARAADAGARAAELERALVALSAHMRVYRTYIDTNGVSEADEQRIRDAAKVAREDLIRGEGASMELLVEVLTMSGRFSTGSARTRALECVVRWQQLTGPLAAKGIEDTAHYRDMALPALNEVGCEPVEPEETDSMVALLRRSGRAGLHPTATHDTKRGEDTRARIAALSWHPAQTTAALDAARRLLGGAISAAGERLLVFTLIALMPLDSAPSAEFEERIRAYLRKASREAKQETSWVEPNADYEAALDTSVARLLFDTKAEDVRRLIRDAARASRDRAAVESLAAVVLKSLAPGVPDFYQGCEFIDLSLVDPDNRRPVDWGARTDALQRLRNEWSVDPVGTADAYLRDIGSDEAKLLVTWRALSVRRWMMAGGEGLVLESLHSMHSGRDWTVSCGPRRCRVELRGRSVSRAVDQLAARDAGDAIPGWPLRVTIDGAQGLRLVGQG